MSRQIEVSTPVYAAIWSARLEGEESENQILERLLLSKATAIAIADSGTPAPAKTGFFDNRNRVEFPPGFKITREYKG